MPNATRELSGDLSEWLRLAADLFARGERYPYAILLKDGTYVGNAGATPHDDGTIELGYWVHAAHLRRGYMTEAVEALMEAFAPASFVIHCHEDNLASQGVARKAGFTHAGFDARGTYREMRWERVVPPR
jgi:RimJ/RimL family protein N-acetyltransferase